MKRNILLIILFIACVGILPVAASSGLDISNVHFKMTLTDGQGGKSEFVDKCENDSAHSAPITADFIAYVTDSEGLEVSDVTFLGQWRVWKQGSGSISSPLITRVDNPTEFYFDEGGVYSIAFVGNVVISEGDTIHVTVTEAANYIFIVKAATSVLHFPNAFSPNGDGINDVFKTKSDCKSIVEFHASIYNRWGQRLYQWDNPAGGWDGTYNGHAVKDGVYYLNVKARGADGIDYEFKKDVNLLRGYVDTDTQY